MSTTQYIIRNAIFGTVFKGLIN